MFVGISFQNIKTITSNAIRYKFITKIYRSAVDVCLEKIFETKEKIAFQFPKKKSAIDQERYYKLNGKTFLKLI